MPSFCSAEQASAETSLSSCSHTSMDACRGVRDAVPSGVGTIGQAAKHSRSSNSCMQTVKNKSPLTHGARSYAQHVWPDCCNLE